MNAALSSFILHLSSFVQTSAGADLRRRPLLLPPGVASGVGALALRRHAVMHRVHHLG